MSRSDLKITYKLHKNKKWLVAVVATTLLVTSGFKIQQIRRENDERNANTEYDIGYNGVNLFTNWITKRVGEDNYVLIDIKDRNFFSIFLQKMQFNYCKKHDIGMGLVVSSNACNLGDLYLDLEYLLSIMEQYEINYPVYLNVDSFIENDNLTKDEAISYIYSFLEKASLHNLYIGVTGKEEYLLEEFKDYDKLAFDSKREFGEMIYQEDGIYYADPKLDNYIQDNYLNYPGLFREDECYICQGDETLRDVAYQFGLSVNDLKKFNDMDDENIKEGTKLRIPSVLQSRNLDFSYVEDNFYKGIDVSHWQGEINWKLVDVDFAIIQIRDFALSGNDKQFVSNVLGCTENNISMGFYAFSRATTIAGIQKEAQYITSQLRSVNVDYPVYLDLETDFWNFQYQDGKMLLKGKTAEETKRFVLEVLNTWETEIAKAGYVPGIYCSQSLYQELNTISDGYLEQLAVWVAGGKYYEQEINYNDKNNIPIIEMSSNIGMKQISSKGILNGIYDENNTYVDIDYCYVDYDKNKHYWDRVEFSNYDFDWVRGIAPLGVGLLSGAWLQKQNHRRKVRKRKKEKERLGKN